MALTDKQKDTIASIFNNYAEKLPENHYLDGTNLRMKDIISDCPKDPNFYKAVEHEMKTKNMSFDDFCEKTKETHKKSLKNLGR